MTSQEAIQAFRKGICTLYGKQMEIDAKQKAMESALLLVAEQSGIDPDELGKRIDEAAAVALQTSLERAESQDPALAALLDLRRDANDLPDETHGP